MKDVVEKTVEAWGEVAEEYEAEFMDIELIKEFADFFIENFKGKTILDVGCGPGRDAKYFAEKGFDVTGIDLSSKFVEMASKNVPNAQFIQMDMRKLEFPDNSFDGIWLGRSFLHIPKKEAKSTVTEFARVLKSGGLIYISLKQGEGEHMVKHLGKERFFSFYTEDEIKSLLESVGLEILEIKVVQRDPSVWLKVYAVKK